MAAKKSVVRGDLHIAVRFRYEAYANKPCKAIALFGIRNDENGHLPAAFESPREFLGEQLYSDWGYRADSVNAGFEPVSDLRREDYRYRTIEVSAEDWPEAAAKIDDEIDTAVEELRGVYDRNRRMVRTMPDDKETLLDF